MDELIKAFLRNPWTIGILTGLIVAIIIFCVKYFMSLIKRKEKKYLEKVKSAKKEVLDIIGPFTQGGNLPSQEVIISLISSISKKYEIEQKDLYSLNEVVDDLIKEVMNSRFISNNTKKRYCNSISKLKERIEIS